MELFSGFHDTYEGYSRVFIWIDSHSFKNAPFMGILFGYLLEPTKYIKNIKKKKSKSIRNYRQAVKRL
jgi:hypothetical protein